MTDFPTPSGGSNMTINFGIVNVPVKYGPVIESTSTRVSGKFLDPETLKPVKQQYVNEAGEVVEKVTGYPYGDTFVVLGEGEAASLKSEKDGLLRLRAYVDSEQVDPLYFDKTYIVWPAKGGDEGYALICNALSKSGRYLIGTIVLSGSEKVFLLRYSGGVLYGEVCVYDENVRNGNRNLVATANAARPEPTADYQALVEQVFETLEDEWDFSSVVDDYNVRLRAAIEATASGKPLPTPKEAPKVPAEDLMAALKASVEAAKTTAADKPVKKSRTKTKA